MQSGSSTRTRALTNAKSVDKIDIPLGTYNISVVNSYASAQGDANYHYDLESNVNTLQSAGI